MRISSGIRAFKWVVMVGVGMILAPGLSAQSVREAFVQFPFKQDGISIVASSTNQVALDSNAEFIRIVTTSELPMMTNTGTAASSGDNAGAATSASQTLLATPPVTTVFKSFTSEDGTKYYAYAVGQNFTETSCSKSTMKMYLADAGEWRDVSSQLLPSLRISEFYGKKNTPNLVDMNGIISFTQEHNVRGVGLGIDYVLPEKGSVVEARLVRRCSPGSPLPAEYEKLYQECQYKSIELIWDKEHVWFITAKKH
jgi:hypothetical protein